MAPINQTAEYLLLRRLVDEGDILFHQLNNMALTKARNDGYAVMVGDYAHITDAGYDRLDEIEDGK